MQIRPRRLRASAALRNLVAENRVHPEQLILPVFVREGLVAPRPIDGLPGVLQHTLESLPGQIDAALAAGIGGVMLFAVPDRRDELGSEAVNPAGILTTAVRIARERAGDQLVVIADLCLDEFTIHGHCGVLDAAGRVDNDATLAIYQRMAVLLAEAGAHMLGASGMMDGQVGRVRQALDEAGFTDTSILAYAAKYSSAFYGPFRGAVESQLIGDRKSYQQDPRNGREALHEVELDAQEGADIVMVKPALGYLDIVYRASQAVNIPIAAYIVSGEMAMIESAAAAGHIDREAAIIEAVESVRRAGATVICTYWALEVAGILNTTKGQAK